MTEIPVGNCGRKFSGPFSVPADVGAGTRRNPSFQVAPFEWKWSNGVGMYKIFDEVHLVTVPSFVEGKKLADSIEEVMTRE